MFKPIALLIFLNISYSDISEGAKKFYHSDVATAISAAKEKLKSAKKEDRPGIVGDLDRKIDTLDMGEKLCELGTVEQRANCSLLTAMLAYLTPPEFKFENCPGLEANLRRRGDPKARSRKDLAQWGLDALEIKELLCK